MRLEIDIAEHHYNNIMALDSVCLGRAPYKGIIMYAINAIKRGRVLEQESIAKNDLVFIHTEGLDEEIRCTMCTNSMKSDRGCDGSCVVNKDMYKAVMDAIEKRIQLITKND